MKILVAEPLAAAGIELLKAQAGWDVVVSNPKEYAQHLPTTDALIVRSAVKVTPEVLAKAPKLRVIGRAGVGVDNVDLPAATAAGVLVMNTPGGNAVSVAEHTIALMLGMARSIPQASVSTKAGKWEKKKFMGSELRGKTLGVIGLGSIGREVVKRAAPFEMRIIATDPYVSSATAADLHVELVDMKTLFAQSDYISLHMALTPETTQMISTGALNSMKDGVRIVNCARGELIDTAALQVAMASGKVAGAGLDVFNQEPPAPDEPLLQQENLIATPHIGGSTEEAQEIVGVRIVEQIVEYLQHGVALNAVNMPALSPDQYRDVAPYVTLAERLGNFAAHVSTGNPKAVRLIYKGRIAEQNTNLMRNAGVAGVLNRSLSRKANLVNSLQLASDRGWAVEERHEKRETHIDSIRLELESDSGCTAVEGAVIVGKPRLVAIDDIYIEAPLSGHLTFLKNDDVPGVIGHVGAVLGQGHINIASFSLGREEQPVAPDHPLEAVSVVETDQAVPDTVLVEILKNQAIRMARPVEFIS
ncbi:MAG TPA: phosphoglycerate dehydrogenase [Bryobacteraceae bacterium]|nr:phosphoglycerate dehydrogenase [Bryobacteraceae bacterium]